MSEQILDRPAAPGASGDGPGGDRSPRGRNRTFLVVAAAIVGGLILGGLILFVLQPFSSEDQALGPVPRGSSAAAAAAAAAAKAAEAAAAQEQVTTTTTKTTLTSRDPFAPLVAKKQATAAAPAPAPAAPDASSSSSDAASSGSTGSTGKGATISALKISPLGNSVALKLDGKKYTVDEGETFAKSYRLYDIFNADCAGFLYGDQNAVVCQGDTVQIG